MTMPFQRINDAITSEVLAAAVEPDESAAHLTVRFTGIIQRPGRAAVILAGETHTFKIDLIKGVVEPPADEPRHRADFDG